jgi:hypothetical protein
MNHVIRIREAIKNGIEALEEESWFGNGTEIHLAGHYLNTALRRENERAALYWHEVMATLRELQQITARTKIIITA